jgi:hypothetical protein
LKEEEKERKYTSDFIEEDYMTRIPSTRFIKLKNAENLIL